MTGSGGDASSPPAANGGDFLLSLLHKHHTRQQHSPLPAGALPVAIFPPHMHQQHQQQLAHDPAVAAVGPALPVAPTWPPSNGGDVPPNFPNAISPVFPPNFLGFPQSSWPSPANQLNSSQGISSDGLRRSGLSGVDASVAIPILKQQTQLEQRIAHCLSAGDVRNPERLPNGNLLENPKIDVSKERKAADWSTTSNGLDRTREFDSTVNSNLNAYVFQCRNSGERGKTLHRGNFRQASSADTRRQHSGFSGKQRERASSDFGNRRSSYEYIVAGNGRGSSSRLGNNPNRSSYECIDADKDRSSSIRLGNNRDSLDHIDSKIHSSSEMAVTEQLDHPGPSAGSSLHSVPAANIEQPLLDLHGAENKDKLSRRDNLMSEADLEVDDIGEEFADSLMLENEVDDKNGKKQHHNSCEKEFRKDNRGRWIMNQRMRNLNSLMECRRDIDRLNAPFLAIYESLIPPEEEKAKQKQLLDLLEKLVCKEWPEARLYLYGSCANSFGVSKSDIDVCLAIDDADINKAEVLLKLADILRSDNLQNVQALTRARVPIVKLMDPATGISCDVCVNNILAVVNTKLLLDYSQIDVRLRQLAFIVKHWAKCRKVNETYQGTLSSYAYVLMCIHFLQHRRPAILPCLQGMEKTYSVTVDDIDCSYFDQVEKLHNFGSCNNETIAQLVWGFFKYWAYVHDYTNSVISVRTGSIISKQEKLWTRRIGNDRHLICIEDPFEIAHDLGRVVDKFSIRVLREEFERAAEIMQYDPNPCVKLFEPYVPS